jgi:hypothetical protein
LPRRAWDRHGEISKRKAFFAGEVQLNVTKAHKDPKVSRQKTKKPAAFSSSSSSSSPSSSPSSTTTSSSSSPSPSSSFSSSFPRVCPEPVLAVQTAVFLSKQRGRPKHNNARAVFPQAGPPIFWDAEWYLILNTAVGGGWPGLPSSATVFPALHRVEYVRVSQRTGEN